MDGLQDLHVLGPGKDAQRSASGGMSHGSTEHIDRGGLVRIWTVRVLGHLHYIVQSNQHGIVGIVRKENCAEVLIGSSGPVERVSNRVAAADLLDLESLHFLGSAVPL